MFPLPEANLLNQQAGERGTFPHVRVGLVLQDLTRLSAILSNVLLHMKLTLRRLASHVPYLPKDWAFWSPGTVVSTQHPHDATIRVRISAIERILVVQLDHDF